MYIYKRSIIHRIFLCLGLISIVLVGSCKNYSNSQKENTLYDTVLSCVLNGDAEIVLEEPVSITEITEIYTHIYEYEPAVNGLSKSLSLKKLNDDSDLVASIGFIYSLSKEEIIERETENETIIDEISASIYSETDVKLKLQKIIETITNGLIYDDEAPDCNTSYAALCKKSANCHGISKAFVMACQKMNINAGYCIGELNGIKHIWNYVKIGNSSIQIDLTSNDNKDYILNEPYPDGTRSLDSFIEMHGFDF